jgi:hypothetical protein
MNVHSIISGDGTICAVINGNHYTVGVGHASYEKIRKAITTLPVNEDELRSLFDIQENVRQLTSGKVQVDLDQSKILYDGTEFYDKDFCERVFRLMERGYDTSCLVNFLNNLGQNPSFRSIMETFKFLCNEGMPLTSDGCFLAYKGVKENFYDEYTSTVNNTPDGRRIEMTREEVCNDPAQSCASGYHVGSYKYAKNWGQRVVLVKVNPRDVVSVPNHECEKMRVCGYWVVLDFNNQPVLDGDLYDVDGNKIAYSDYLQKCQDEAKVSYDFDTSLESDEEGRGYCDYEDDYDEDDYDDDDDEEVYGDEYDEEYDETDEYDEDGGDEGDDDDEDDDDDESCEGDDDGLLNDTKIDNEGNQCDGCKTTYSNWYRRIFI